MKTAVVFYSLEGSTKQIAQAISKALTAELIELVPEKAYSTAPFMKYVWGGKSVVFHEQPALQNGIPDLSGYDNMILGTPIWAGSYTPPFETLVRKSVIKGKKIALFACHLGGGAAKCFENFKTALPENNFVGESDYASPQKNIAENEKKAAHWALSLQF